MTQYKPDKLFLIVIGILLVFGLVILSSAGISEGQDKFDSAQYFLFQQIKNGLLPGLLLFFLLGKIKYKIWEKFSAIFLLGAISLLVMAFIPPFSSPFKGAFRWVSIGPFLFQPSEILKLAVIVYFAAWFDKRRLKLDDWSYSVAPVLMVLGFISLLLIMQPDVGTLGVVLLISIAIYFSTGVSMKHFLMVNFIFLLVFIVLILIEPYRLERFLTFINPASDIQGSAYHIRQAVLGIGSGGVWGVGFGKGIQKINFLPEPVGDSIFVVLAEELGLVGAGFLFAMLLVLAVKMIKIAKHAPDNFARLTVIGVLAWVLGQAFMNIGAVSGLIPLTGLPLPFISYGGTALTSILGALGIVSNISKYSRK